MVPFLLWIERDRGVDAPGIEETAGRFERYLSGLLGGDVTVERYRNRGLNLLYYPLPPEGWLPASVQEDADTWALAIEYPLNGHREAGIADGPAALNALPAVARAVQRAPEAALARLNPPALLFWEDRRTNDCYLVNDGMGSAQLFEYSYRGMPALSDRIFAFRALSLPLYPDIDEWAFKAAVGFFPMDTSGYRGIRYVPPATLYRWDGNELTSLRRPVFPEWVRQEPREDAACFEAARRALMDYVASTRCLYSDASGGLSGGFDSRAVFSTFRALGLPLRARVKGSPEKYDVILAGRLAQIAGLDLRVKSGAELPPDTVERLSFSIDKAMLWQSGYMFHHKLKTFLASGDTLPRGSVSVTGQEGELARGKYRVGPIEKLGRRIPDSILPERRRAVERMLDRIWEKEIRPLGLDQPEEGDAFYLYEHVRRFLSGSQHTQTSQVIAPFDSIDFLRAVFSFRGDTTRGEPFHRYIIGRNAPDWLSVPFENEVVDAGPALVNPSNPGPGESQRGPGIQNNIEVTATHGPDWRRSIDGHQYYDRDLYWNTVGKPLVEEARAQGRLWREIFRPEWTEQQRPSRYADVLAMLYALERLTGG